MATNFDWQFETLDDPHLAKMLAAARAYASAFRLAPSPYWLSLVGSSGVGKTHLAKRIAAFWNKYAGERYTSPGLTEPLQHRPAKFIPWREFIDTQRQGNFSIAAIREAWFVILDDVGTEHDPSGFAKARLFDILDARLGKWTMLTSNLGLRQIAAIDQRISSRMIRGENKVVTLEGVTDFALRKQ